VNLRAERRRVGRALRAPFGRLTTRGRAVLAAGITAALCALALGQRDLLRVGVLLAVVPLLTVVVLGRARYRLACTRTLRPARVEAGQPAKVVLEVANVSGARCGLVLAEEHLPYVLGSRPRFVLPGLEPGERRAISYPVRSDVRGRFTIGPLTLTLTDPFGMGEHRRAFSVRDELVVTPPVSVLPPVSLSGDWTGSGDTRPRAVASSGQDDSTTREYRQGDDLRRVHWRSTARRGELMVRREEQPWQSRATLLLDRRRTAHVGQGAGSTFEWSVAALASVAVHLTGRGYAVRLADGERPDTGPTDTTASAVLDALASVDVAGEVELDRAVSSAASGSSGGLVIAVLAHLDATDVALLARLNQAGTSCVALVADGSAGLGPVRAGAHRAALDLLRATGWDVVVAEPGETLASTWGRIGSGRALLTGGAR